MVKKEDPVSKLIEQLTNADSESRYHEKPPEVVIYCPGDADYQPFLEIESVEYNYEENRIHINAK